MSMSLTSPAPSYAEDRFVVIRDPRPGTIVEVGPGSHLAVRFRRGLGASRWHVAGLPGHLLALPVSVDGGHEFQFLVFGAGSAAAPVRFERRHPERDMAHEVCELLVLPVSDVPRTA
ncbi:hypothetical protein [Nocardioides halotolerans]|jgi:hypothetical protein|uniref:hypothetical protein n=1 Tax=Nocardioides halotolerans TaxID=433660 RepID=UPI00041F4E47|nr:hypothetical protein [Nocardioides halotolerans]